MIKSLDELSLKNISDRMILWDMNLYITNKNCYHIFMFWKLI